MERDSSDFLASELRAGPGEEWIQDAQEDERLTELLRRRRRELSQVLLEIVHRGDRVRAELVDRSVVGMPTYAGSDFLTVESDESTIDVVAGRATWVIERQTEGGLEQGGRRLTFRARLAEIAETGATITVVTSSRGPRTGPITTVAPDHIELGGQDGEVLIPLGLIVAVVRPKAPQ